jgi:hypothetical protein
VENRDPLKDKGLSEAGARATTKMVEIYRAPYAMADGIMRVRFSPSHMLQRAVIRCSLVQQHLLADSVVRPRSTYPSKPSSHPMSEGETQFR